MTKNADDDLKRGLRELSFVLRNIGHPELVDETGQLNLPGLYVDAKRSAEPLPYDALTQAKNEAAAGEIPVVMRRKRGRPWVVVLRLEDFIGLYKKGDDADG